VRFFLFLCLSFLFVGYARGQSLEFTIPSTNAYMEGDSVFFCTGGDTTSDIAWVRFMRQDVTGGPAWCFDSLYVRGSEGRDTTFHVDPGPGAHFYTQTVDTLGNLSCWSGGVFFPGYVTAVGDNEGPAWRNPVSVRIYDVQGRLAEGHLASGIYRKVEIYADGRRRYTMLRVVR